ncbi:MAG: hypothetical protein ACI316_02375, partial [Lactimicrobium massiliense]
MDLHRMYHTAGIILVAVLTGCGSTAAVHTEMPAVTPEMEDNTMSTSSSAADAYTLDTPIADVINDPAFDGKGRLLFPTESGYYSGSTLGDLRLVWYHNMVPERT